MELTLAHWIYGLFTLLILITMLLRKGIVLPALMGIFAVAAVFNKSLEEGFTAIFQANLIAAKELFSIFLIITFMLALLHALKDLGADERLVMPFRKIMKNGHLSFFTLIAITYPISLFFWPTPAVPLICTLLVPAAVRAGLPPMLAAAAVAIAGQGMALSSDYIVQVAPALSAKSAGVDTASIADKSLILSLITGCVAVLCAYFFYRKEIRSADDPKNNVEAEQMVAVPEEKNQIYSKHPEFWSRIFSVIVPLGLTAAVLYMLCQKINGGRMSGFEGGNGAAFIGGVAVMLLLLTTISYGKLHALDYVSQHLTEGFVFAFKAMGPVIPIAGFFFIGSSEFSADILGVAAGESPALLFDLVAAAQQYLPDHAIFTAFGMLLIGMITGLDGSGFSGLPLTGALAQSLQSGSLDASVLAAIGQMGAVWTGGGTLVAWSSLIAIAGFCGVSSIELARKNFLPVIIGLLLSTKAAILLF